MRSAFLGLLLLSLAACSSDKQTPSLGLEMIRIGMAKIGGLGKDQLTPTAAQIKASATPEALARIGKPVMLAELPDIGLADILIFVQQNGPYTTWSSSDGVTFAFKDGLLVGTRGMGRDLMSADVEEAARGLANGAGSGVRVQRYLDGDDQMIFSAFYCRYYRIPNGGVSELCKSRKYQFENRYWLNNHGQILKSRQWIGPERGYLISERLS